MTSRADRPERGRAARVACLAAGVALAILLFESSGWAATIRVAVTRHLQTALLYLADEQGFFKKRGLDIAITEYESGAAAVDDLIAGKIDIVRATEFVFVLQSLKHRDVRILAAVCSSSDMELVVRKDRGIMEPKDLTGKRVAVTRGSWAEFSLYNYLIFNGIPVGNVKIVHHGPKEMVAAMADGKIDAGIGWPPFTAEMAKRLGPQGARWPSQSGQDYYQVLFAKDGFLKTQAQAIERFVAALAEAEGFIADYPDRVQTLLRNRLKVDVEPFLAAWSRTRFQLQMTQDMLIVMEREARWAIRNKLADAREMPNYLDFFYFDALDRVKPEGVTIVH